MGRCDDRKADGRTLAAALRIAVCLQALCGVVAITGDAGAAGVARYQGATDYAVRDDDRQLGTIRVYTYDRGLFVWPENLLPFLGISVEQNPQSGIILFHLRDGSSISIDRDNRTYAKNGTSHDIGEDMIVRDSHLEVSLDLLNRILPEPIFLPDRAGKTISVEDADCGRTRSWCRKPGCPPSQTCAKPSGVPALRSFIYDSAAERPAAPPPSSPQPAPVAAQPAPPPPAVSAKIDTLILQPRIKDLPPKNDYIEVLVRAGIYFLPLNDVVQLFGFPIKVDVKHGTASGYLFSPDDDFQLDIPAKRMRVGKQQFTLADQDVLVQDGALYVSTDAFAKWFGVNSEVNPKQQTIHFETTQKLPEEESEERSERWRKLLEQSRSKDEELPLLENPYRLIDYPVFDVTLNALHNHQPAAVGGNVPSTTADYNVRGVGDIGYATGHIYMAGGTAGRGVDTLRLTAGRDDPDAALLGPLHATEFALGDITSPSLTLVTSNSIGRGAMVTNRDLEATENFDVRSFTGDAVPGYQAELYRNGELLAFQTVGSDGRYNFNNIQILYGENVFRIVLYGPQGQKEERVQTVEASASVLKSHQLEYSFGVDQRGASLIPVTPDRQGPFTPVGLQAVAQLRYGVTSFLTAGAFGATTRLENGEHYYYGASLAGTLGGLQAETNYVRDARNNGWAAGVSALTSIYGLNLRGYYRRYDRFASEAVNANDTPLSSEMGVDSYAQALLPLIGTFSYGLSATRQTYESPLLHPADTYTFRLAKNVVGVGFDNEFYFQDYPSRMLQDTFSFQSRLWTVDVRLSGIYQFQPRMELQDLNLTTNYLLTDRLSGQSEIDKGPATSNNYTFTQTLYYDFDAFRLGFFGEMDTKGTYSTGLNLTFSLSHNPISGHWRSQPRPYADDGAIAGRIYVKPNGDDADSALAPKNARVVVDNSTLPVDQKDGYVAGWIAPYRKTKVEIDPNSIADPLLSPEHKGYEVMTRPGSTVVADFPMIMTTTIEGNAYILDKQNNKQPLKEAVVELEDKDGKPLRRTITEFDGYFSFDKIGAGHYQLGVPTEVLKDFHAVIKVAPAIDIAKVTEFISNRDIVLAPEP